MGKETYKWGVGWENKMELSMMKKIEQDSVRMT